MNILVIQHLSTEVLNLELRQEDFLADLKLMG